MVLIVHGDTLKYGKWLGTEGRLYNSYLHEYSLPFRRGIYLKIPSIRKKRRASSDNGDIVEKSYSSAMSSYVHVSMRVHAHSIIKVVQLVNLNTKRMHQ